MKRKNLPNTRSTDPLKPTTEQIATAAYHLYAESGYQNGHDQEHWLRAEELLTQRLKSSAKVLVADPNPEQPSQTVESRPKATPKQLASPQPQWRSETVTQLATSAVRGA